MIDFSVNLNPLGPPKGSFRVLKKSMEDIIYYPKAIPKECIESLSDFLKVSEDNVTIGNGATEIFFLLPKILDIKNALIVSPTFWEYEYTLKKYGVHPSMFFTKPNDNFHINFKYLKEKLKTAKFAYICNPNNPTSVLVNKEELMSIFTEFPKCVFIIDETYLPFLKGYSKMTLTKHVESTKNLIVVTSFSKIFSLPGLRIGFVASDESIISRFKKFEIPFRLNKFSEKILPYLLTERKYLEKTRDFVRLEKERVYSAIKTIPSLHPFKPDANFILIRLVNKMTSVSMKKCLEELGIVIRDCSKFNGLGDKWIRVCINKRENNEILIKGMKKILVKQYEKKT